jgi:hypothetical protein
MRSTPREEENYNNSCELVPCVAAPAIGKRPQLLLCVCWARLDWQQAASRVTATSLCSKSAKGRHTVSPCEHVSTRMRLSTKIEFVCRWLFLTPSCSCCQLPSVWPSNGEAKELAAHRASGKPRVHCTPSSPPSPSSSRSLRR